MFRDRGSETVNLGEDIGHVFDVAHWEGGVDLAHVRSSDESSARLKRRLVSTAREDVEVVLAAHRLCKEFCGKDFFFSPHHAVLECGIDDVFLVKAMVHDFDVVDKANVANAAKRAGRDPEWNYEETQLLSFRRIYAAMAKCKRGTLRGFFAPRVPLPAPPIEVPVAPVVPSSESDSPEPASPSPSQ